MLAPLLLMLVPLLLILIGFLMLWSIYRQPPPESGYPGTWTVIGKTIAWLLFLLGVFAAVGILTNFLFLLGWAATAIILIAMLSRYRNSETESLLWMLMVAAERGIPLEAAARAFAEERNDSIGMRARQLAEYLEAGVPLALSLQRTRHRLPPAALLAADLGQQTGRLAPALRQVVTQLDEFDPTLRNLLEKVFYLAVLLLIYLTVLTFLMLKIVPMFQKIMIDFGMELPAVSQVVIGVAHFTMMYWFLLLPIILLLLYCLFSGLLYYTGLLPGHLPPFRGIWWRIDSAWVMRWMANGIRQKRPIIEMVRLLAGFFPESRMRSRLAWAASRIDQGADWCESLRQAGIVRSPECAVFRSAERVGNLAWAFEEMADSTVRRLSYRLRAYVALGFPLVILAFGLCVMAVQVGMLMPLVSLIQHLV